MTLPAAILSQFRDTVVVSLVGPSDAYGGETTTTAKSVRCRISHARMMVSTPGGDQVRTAIVIHMEDIPEVTNDTLFTLSDGIVLSPKSVSRPAWPDGSRHLKVVL